MLWVLLTLLLSQISVAQNRLPSFQSSHLKEIWVDKNLKGFPERFIIEEYNYNRDSAKLLKSEISRIYYYQDKKLKQLIVEKNGKPIETYAFDNYGRIIKQLRSDKFESIPRISYSYNENELTAEEIVYRLTGTVHSRTLLRYDDQKRIIAREEYRGIDKLNRYWLYTYNSQNDLVTDEYYDLASIHTSSSLVKESEPTIITQLKYNYNSKGKKTNQKTLKDDVLFSSSEFRYFPDSLVKETLLYQTNGWPSERHVEVKHDSARVLVKGYYNSDDTTSYRSRFKEVYVDGDLIEYESRTLKGTFVDRYATFYEFDHNGNWIKKLLTPMVLH